MSTWLLWKLYSDNHSSNDPSSNSCLSKEKLNLQKDGENWDTSLLHNSIKFLWWWLWKFHRATSKNSMFTRLLYRLLTDHNRNNHNPYYHYTTSYYNTRWHLLWYLWWWLRWGWALSWQSNVCDELLFWMFDNYSGNNYYSSTYWSLYSRLRCRLCWWSSDKICLHGFLLW